MLVESAADMASIEVAAALLAMRAITEYFIAFLVCVSVSVFVLF